MELIGVRILPEEKAKLCEIVAKSEFKNMSEVVRAAIKAYLN